MAIPIVLYDENHERVGETYHRRAKQLVRSGRAVWLEEGHSLQMAPYQTEAMQALPPLKEETFTMTESIYTSNGIAPESTETAGLPHPASHNELRMYLARQNVARKRNLIRNIIAYIAIWPILFASYFGLLHRHIGVSQTVTGTNTGIHGHFGMPQVFSFGRGDVEFRPYSIENSAQVYIIERMNEAFSGWLYPQNILTQYVSIPGRSGTFMATYTHNYSFWFFIVGIMFAWGIWILARGINTARQHMQNRPVKPSRPDPVALEYQRLSSMADNS